MKMIKKTSKCLISKKDIYQILDFGMQPYADTFINQDQLNLNEPVFPLEIFLNPENGMVQVGFMTNDFDRYNLYSYSYTSSNSNFSKNHWRKVYKNITFSVGNRESDPEKCLIGMQFLKKLRNSYIKL